MKSLLLSLLFSCLCFMGYSQIIITEIMYNPPESGTDSLEYIEIHNAGLTGVDISGYHFLQGVEDTVVAGTMLPAGASYVFTENARALNTVLGVTADEWTDGALSNGGETLELADASGTSIDIVEFSDRDLWPSSAEGTDGGGASIELCDYTADNNLGTNWRAATNDTGVELNGNTILATAGALNTATCMVTVDHTIEVSSNLFTPADITINIGETIRWENVGGNHNINGTQATYPNNIEDFGNGAASTDAWTYDYTFTQVGVNDYQCDPHVGLGMVGTVTVIDPNAPSYPRYGIGAVTTVDADGVADSLGVSCSISGTVHGINFRPAGLTFTLINGFGDGIGVFNNSGDLGYTFNEGDVLLIEGAISQFNGLTQIVPATITVVGNDDLVTPTPVDILDESTESQLVTFMGTFAIGEEDGQWKGDGSSFNVDVTTDSGNILTMRIDSDTELASSTFVTGCNYFKITGLGGQFDADAPYDSGYQVFPRYGSDVECLTNTNDLALDGPIRFTPNPTEGLVYIDTELQIENYIVTDVLGQVLSKGQYNAVIDLSEFQSGLYQVTLIKADRAHTARIVKQ